MEELDKIKEISGNFFEPSDIVKIEPYGDGHINSTYKVTLLDNVHGILQQVNHTIFTDVAGLMENIEGVTAYLNTKPLQSGSEVLKLLYTHSGESFYTHTDGTYWRVYDFIEGATGHTFTEDVSKLYQAGRAFGYFQVLLRDYPVDKLHETIPNFHNTPKRLERFKEVLESDSLGRAQSCQKEIDFVLAHQSVMAKITDAIAEGSVPLRVTHNDTKLNNVLIDDKSGLGRTVIDLDTIMPGSALYDFGDAIRSCGSTVAEDSEDLSNLELDIPRFEAFTKGFLEDLGPYLTQKELELFPYGAIIMTLECGMRFLTDYLEGDVYFKVHKDGHNLIRAKNQFAFVAKMEENLQEMESIVKKYL